MRKTMQQQKLDLPSSAARIEKAKERLQNTLFQLEDMLVKRLKEADSIASQAASAGTVKELRQLHEENQKLKRLCEQEKNRHSRMLEVNRIVSDRLDKLLDEVSAALARVEE